MTKEQKASRIAEIKAEAFDDISDLRLTIDSHRNFHTRVSNVVREANHMIAEVRRLADRPTTQQNLIRCQASGCAHMADSQVYDGEESFFFCERHAQEALLKNPTKLVFIEDLPPAQLDSPNV